MEHLLQTISTLLDLLYSEAVGPFFTLIDRSLDVLIIRPLQILQMPPVLQVMVIAVLTGMFSVAMRRCMGSEEKDAVFREKFVLRKQSQNDLKVISDWKSRETFAKVIDDEIDRDFNTYLSERFARHGLVYLLPIFLCLFWLEHAIKPSGILIALPQNRFGIQGIYMPFVFLLTYCTFILIFFLLRRKKHRPASD